MKSWADHCSSDEESLDDIADDLQAQKLADDNVAPPPPAAVDVATSAVAVEEEAAAAGPVEDAPPRVYDFPDKPPFTAFIGNLAYSLNDPEELKEAVAKCALDNLQGETINILGARISFGRDGKHRGFGYLEVETLEQLKALMQLNDGEGTIVGRKVQLDTANGNKRDNNNNNNNNRRGSHNNNPRRGDGGNNIDGSRFRGGKFNNPTGGKDASTTSGSGPPGQRPSLKLAPRTKKVEDAIGGVAPASIFGGAKPRDAQTWEEKRDSTNKNSTTDTKGGKNNNNDRQRSSQGARGGGRGGEKGRGGGGKGGDNGGRRSSQQAKRESKQKEMISPEERAAAAAAKAASEAAAPPAAAAPAAADKPKVPANKFALLMDDSDSD